MDDKLINSLMELISEQTGLNIRGQDCNKFTELIEKRTKFLHLPSSEEYYFFLKREYDKARLEKQELINQLTTGESYFFRDKGQFSLLKNQILPEIIERRQKERTLRIWSAGCSTGEELYSLAILLDEMRNSKLIEKTPHSALEDYILMARKYADSGQYDKAEAECRKALDIDKTAVRPYFLLAHILEIKGNAEEAKELFKRVIYLDPGFVPAYLELGALYERENDSERAKKMRTTAVEFLMKLPSDSAVEPYEGVTAGELLESIDNA